MAAGVSADRVEVRDDRARKEYNIRIPAENLLQASNRRLLCCLRRAFARNIAWFPSEKACRIRRTKACRAGRLPGEATARADCMSKSSTVTVREKPVEEVASVKAGGLTIHGETFIISTDQRIELVDLTNRVMEFARRFNIREGLVSLWSMHTTCALFINEFQTALLADIRRFLEQMVARDAEWMHNDPEHSDCDRMNADSHLRALLLGHNLTLQISGGEVVLGQWQRILMAELDGPRARSLRIQILGVS
ncbi:MAG: secondary thiamine-phosphate synthase enzyme YjbQ [Acidobacteriota bacterium]